MHWDIFYLSKLLEILHFCSIIALDVKGLNCMDFSPTSILLNLWEPVTLVVRLHELQSPTWTLWQAWTTPCVETAGLNSAPSPDPTGCEFYASHSAADDPGSPVQRGSSLWSLGLLQEKEKKYYNFIMQQSWRRRLATNNLRRAFSYGSWRGSIKVWKQKYLFIFVYPIESL